MKTKGQAVEGSGLPLWEACQKNMGGQKRSLDSWTLDIWTKDQGVRVKERNTPRKLTVIPGPCKSCRHISSF